METTQKQNIMERIRIIDGTVLKLIAMLTMVIDHIGDIFFPEVFWMRFVGRIAMPIFAFFIAEGYSYTHDRKKYLLRLGLFALISELPFDFAFDRGITLTHQNIMLTFFLAVLALLLWDRITQAEGKTPVLKILAGCIVIMIISILATLLCSDYSFFGIL